MSRLTNALAQSSSPYLRLHAKNPIPWQEYSKKTLEFARSNDKVLFLSIGYAACHWCHVMAHESFENEEIGQFLGDHFVCVKVDREQRPDVDRLYMTFVQETTGSGGWPLTVFATPDGQPFYGGTYFPPVDGYGRPGFGTLVRRIAEMWHKDSAEIVAHASEATKALATVRPALSGSGSAWPTLAPIVRQQVAASFDRTNAGFSRDGPKFPRPVTLELLTALVGGGSSTLPADPATRTCPAASAIDDAAADYRLLASLGAMERGGLQDHVGGGFHRYTVDDAWAIPHFEKMLYDQAQLAAVLVGAVTRYRTAAEGPRFATALRRTCEYLLRDLRLAGGAFASAQDAEATPEDEQEAAERGHGERRTVEGAYWVWPEAQVRSILAAGEPFASNASYIDAFVAAYQMDVNGNAPPGTDPHGELSGKNHLRRLSERELARVGATLSLSPDEVARVESAGLGLLLEHRARRPPPLLDDKVIYAWNCQAVGALARASAVLGDRTFLDAALACLAFLDAKLTRASDGRLLRAWRQAEPGEPDADDIPAFAEDYGAACLALLDLFDVTSDARHLAAARRRLDEARALFWDDEHGGFFATGCDVQGDLLVRLKEDYDGAEPAGGSCLALAAVRLAGWEEGRAAEQLRTVARRTLAAFGTSLAKAPVTVPLAATAAWLLEQPPLHLILVVGSSAAAATRRDELLRRLREQPLPRYAYVLSVPAADLAATRAPTDSVVAAVPWLADSLPPLADEQDGVALCVCADFACRRPATTDDEVQQVLADLQ